MSQFSSRPALLCAAALACVWSCAGAQHAPELASAGAVEQAPVMETTPPAGADAAPAPNGQPPGLPPLQGVNAGTENNTLASPAVGAPAKAQLSEEQIARIAELVNAAEIAQGKLAGTKAKSARVKAFAAKMVNHHGQAQAEQARLGKQLHLSSAESAEAATLKTEGERTLATLKSAPAADFDRAYVDSQVAVHQTALALIDEQLLPSAKTDGVVRALRVARDAVAAHLEEAKALQAELPKATK